MTLDDLPTPCLVLDRTILRRNIAAMAAALGRHGVPLRPHMKTAKSIDVARLALAGQPGGITVSTLAEASYFAAHGITEILYAVGITPRKLDDVARLGAGGADIAVITDDLDTAAAIAARPAPPRALIEIDTGEARGGVSPDDEPLLRLAERLGPRLVGVMTHAGHSYGARSGEDMRRIAEAERAGALRAAARPRGCAPRVMRRRLSRSAARPPRCTPNPSKESPKCAPASICSVISSRRRSARTGSTTSPSRCWPA